MPTEYALENANNHPLGTFVEVQGIIRDIFPETRFTWTTSGKEKLALAKERGVKFPEELAKSLESLPSLLEGHFEDSGSSIQFGLGYREPVMCLYITPIQNTDSMKALITKLEERLGGQLVISGQEKSRRSDDA